MFMELLNDNVLLALTNTNMSGSSAFKCVKIKQSCTCTLQIYKILSIGIHFIRSKACYFKCYLECCPVENFHSECPWTNKEDF